MFFFFGFSGITSILKGLGDSKTPLYFMIISAVMIIYYFSGKWKGKEVVKRPLPEGE